MITSIAETQRLLRGGLRAALSQRARTLEPGDCIRDYVVRRLIGRGGFGDVYEVEHSILHHRAALKLLHARHAGAVDLRTRFEREARIIHSLRHPNLVEVREFGETATRQPFFVMELLDGTDLAHVLVERGRFEPQAVAEILGPVCDALSSLHAASVVHRDLKPSNVFVTRSGRVVLLDLGVAKPLHTPALTRSGQQLGTPAYMAPEQLSGAPIDARTDVYQLGALAFEMLTGRAPFADPSVQVMQMRHMHAPREAPSKVVSVPRAIDDVVMRAMARDPVDRYATAAALCTAFRDAVRPATGSRSYLPTVALHVEAFGDDDQLDGLFAHVRDELARHAFSVATDTGNSLLAVRPVASDDRNTAFVALGAAVAAAASARGILVDVTLHAGDAEWLGGRCVGGPLTTLDWVTGEPGLHVSPALLG
jgi:serine/threonine-protein kinase